MEVVLAPVHPSGAPQGAEELTACFPNPKELLVPGAEVAQARHSAHTQGGGAGTSSHLAALG